MQRSSGTSSTLLDSLDVKTNSWSPLFISGGPGLVSLSQPVLMPDGDGYFSVFCSHWEVQVPGGYDNLQKSLENNGNLLGKYTLVGYVDSKPVISIQSNQIRAWAICPFVVNKKVFDVNNFYERTIHNLSSQYNSERSSTTTGSMERDRSETALTH